MKSRVDLKSSLFQELVDIGMRVKAILLPEKDRPCDGVMPIRMLSRPKR